MGILLKNYRKKARRALDKEQEKEKKHKAKIEALEKFQQLPEEERQKRLEAKKACDILSIDILCMFHCLHHADLLVLVVF